MKKTTILFLFSIFVISCAPKRTKCYGRRCVEKSIKKDVINSTKVNS